LKARNIKTTSSEFRATVRIASGAITSGAWNGTIISTVYGGTGLNLTGTSGVLTVSSGTVSASTTSSAISTAISDKTGSGALTFATSPDFTTSVTTSSGTFAVFNTNATTINAFGAATTMSLGAASGTATFNSLNNTTSASSGALVISGGVGIGRSVSVGGRLLLFNGSTYTGFVSAQVGTGNTVYTLPTTSPATGSSVLQSTSDGVMSWVPMTATGGGSVNVAAAIANTTINIIGVNGASGSGLAVSSGTGLTYNLVNSLLTSGSYAGTWAGSTITAFYGGTGLQGPAAIGDLIVANTTTTWSRLTTGVTSGHVLTSNGSNALPSWQAVPPAAASSVAVVPTVVNSQFSITTVNTSNGTGLGLSTISTFVINPSTGLVSLSGLAVTAGTNASSTLSAAFTVLGGLGITGNAFIGGTTVITNTTASTSTVSGALVVSGGVGIGGSLFTGTSTPDSISGVILNNGVITSGSWSATAITTNYGGTGFQTYAIGDILYASTANSLGKLTVGTINQILSSNGSIPTWVSGAGLTVGFAYQITTAQTNLATTLYPLFANASTGAIGASIDTDIVYNALSNILTVPIVYSGTAHSSPIYTSNASLAIRPGTNATTAIQLQKADGTSILNVDSTNNRIGIVQASPAYPLDVNGSVHASSGSSYLINGRVVLNETTLGNSVVSIGTITTGVWAATALTSHYGGTGLQSPFVVGDILYATTTTTWGRLAASSTSGQVLTSNGSGTLPTWQAVPASSATSVAVNPTIVNSQFSITAVSAATGTGLGLSTVASLVINPSTGIVSMSGLAVTALTQSTNSTTGALIVTGGASVGQSLSVGGRLNIFNASNFIGFRYSGTVDTPYLLPNNYPQSALGTSVLASATDGSMRWVGMSAGGSATPGGNNKQIQFNNASSFGGASGFEYSNAGIAITVAVFSPSGTGYTSGLWINAINGSTTRVGIGLSNPQFELEILGEISATNKSFVIDHPTKDGMKLRYGSLEGPENGVYVRGELKGTNIIEVPDHWIGLVHEDSYTVHLTPIGRFSQLYVEKIENYNVFVADTMMCPIHCYYSVWAERKDIPKLVTEYEAQ
jgi:hypothetical protein